MSGGVDSSVAAALAVQAGHQVTGVTLKLWGGEGDSGCCSVSDVDDARWVANRLGIDHHVFNFGEDFDTHVVDPYVQAYSQGLTPNPCIECNRHVKFDKLLRRADALGFESIATGHHASIDTDMDPVSGHETYYLTRGADAAKDQSYVLHMLGQRQLRRLTLPVGSMTKERVREIATELGLETANKPDSQDVCFIHSVGGRQKFLGERIPLTPGNVVDESGEAVGTVQAVELITVGQRRGLGVGGNADRKYVTAIDHQTSTVTLGERPGILREGVKLRDLAWASEPVSGPVVAQCSAHGQERSGTLSLDGQVPVLSWDSPQPAVSPGQSVVFYRGRRVLGGAISV